MEAADYLANAKRRLKWRLLAAFWPIAALGALWLLNYLIVNG